MLEGSKHYLSRSMTGSERVSKGNSSMHLASHSYCDKREAMKAGAVGFSNVNKPVSLFKQNL